MKTARKAPNTSQGSPRHNSKPDDIWQHHQPLPHCGPPSRLSKATRALPEGGHPIERIGPSRVADSSRLEVTHHHLDTFTINWLPEKLSLPRRNSTNTSAPSPLASLLPYTQLMGRTFRPHLATTVFHLSCHPLCGAHAGHASLCALSWGEASLDGVLPGPQTTVHPKCLMNTLAMDAVRGLMMYLTHTNLTPEV
ncbi:hypothetical protein E2C01_063398 [Portunus trituberculatus]|uniref:Uncharacterized protein n=1 Tax=Portunus trituberculatus TaxID=210409 RepID=A0A5B7HG96_PORTR|nr:hypothetical protein [Portunus trituberculatus]